MPLVNVMTDTTTALSYNPGKCLPELLADIVTLCWARKSIYVCAADVRDEKKFIAILEAALKEVETVPGFKVEQRGNRFNISLEKGVTLSACWLRIDYLSLS
ncbi:MAG: hypothetical protein A3H67_04950 [Candidatus Buchananbacteria bacterium RIFCSPLOWO2_02_FULL_46_11b]|uniref:Uncharacterized protein n=1 Tax=Candidatus Buchananbacteria bacterium RIFCSPLOWO2_02_FULL_46_11b TaxID=1797548 RepID=A0A1G1Z008_9BACT|nr:MAG: hypothetical protein A3H67_04950 [Candidatus Buchananbacteria bacterium RIFCSPLOWO2_02_FULL_46_11b]